ncbi:MAG: ABC transporter permease [Candidatus Aenigmatarchaeota archaeon]
MKINDILKFSIRNLKHRRLRSWLTIIGIIIGVAAVVTLISLAEGIKGSIESELTFFGADVISVIPGHFKALEEVQFGGGLTQSRIGNLTENDIRTIKGIPGVVYVDGYNYETADVSYGGQIASTTVSSAEPEIFDVFEFFEIEKGRALIKGDSYVAVLGNKVAYDVFKEPIELNRQIKINGKTFRVVGILKQAGFFGAFDSMVIIPKQIGDIVLESDEIAEIVVKLSDQADTEYIADQIKKKLLLSHHLKEEDQDFTVITTKSVEDTVSRITTLLTFFWGSIAAISLLVGGIGIANTMFMSVMERTREIGILKALGTTNSEVVKLFLIESGLIGLIGGIIGILFGFLATIAITSLGYTNPMGISMKATLTPELTLFALIFSIFVGVISGIFPARKAARLQPVEALRYE